MGSTVTMANEQHLACLRNCSVAFEIVSMPCGVFKFVIIVNIDLSYHESKLPKSEPRLKALGNNLKQTLLSVLDSGSGNDDMAEG